MDDRVINETWVKIGPTKFGPVPPGLVKVGEDVVITVNQFPFEFNCVQETYNDNQDGTFDLIHTLKFVKP